MNHFRFVTHLETMNVIARLAKHAADFKPLAVRYEDRPEQPVRTMLLRGPEELTLETWLADSPLVDLPLLQGWKSLNILLGRIRKAVGTPEPFGRVMICKLLPHGVMPWHTDNGAYHDNHIRFHVPLVTNPLCQLYAQNEMVHMPVGSLWWLNNKVVHTAANWGEAPRYHLIVDFRRAVTEETPDE